MKSYIIAAECEGVKKYVYYDFKESTSFAVEDRSAATPFPNKFVCNAVCRALKPAIKQAGLDVKLSVESLEG